MAEIGNEQLAPHHIKDAPPSMFYIPNFITAEEEEYILNKVEHPHTRIRACELISARSRPNNG